MLYETQNPHGGDVYGMEVRLDFSSNVNPLGPPPSVISAMQRACAQVRQYPDPYCRALTRAIAAHEGVPERSILCGAGAAELIYAYCDALRPKKIAELAPTFSEYSAAAAHFGASVARFSLHAPNFAPDETLFSFLESEKPDALFLCTPNNPTGAAYTRDQLKAWVEYARKNNAIILYDAAYECFISDGELARSIFEIEGARECAIEICSFSKIAGFTGTRCGYTIVPKELERDGMSLNKLWLRRQTTKFNGVPYIVQRGAAAVFTESGMAEIQHNLDYYRQNAKVIADALDECGVWYCGGKNSPYIWLRCPGSMKSWEFFDWLLENCGVVGTPGVGFGECGEGYFRLTAFGDAEKTKTAAERIKAAIKAL